MHLDSTSPKEVHGMNIWQFMSEHPWLTFFLVLIIKESIVNTINRVMRHWNIHKYGYPPPHCDADGDFRKEQR
jgi:hypothetical protein